MCHSSPARVLRNVKRITKFLERKSKRTPVLSRSVLEPNNIIPATKSLSVCNLPGTSIPAKKSCLSVRKFQSIEVIPESQALDDLLFSTYIDGFSHRTTFVCSFWYDDFSYKSCSAIRNHISEAHRAEMTTKLKTYSISLPRYEVMSF